MNKRGQVTIFMIIGVILVFSSGLVFFIRNSLTEDSLEASLRSSVSRVPVDILPVKEFVDTCLRQVSIDGLNYIGARGGYYNTSEFYDVKDISRNAVTNVPYWYHMASCGNPYGCVSSMQPTLSDSTNDSLKTELENYVEDNLPFCINEFRTFENFFTIEEQRNPNVEVIIRAKDVFFRLDYPIQITNQAGNTIDASSFLQTIKVDLYNIYNFANELITRQSEEGFMETIILNAMAPYRGEELPPFYDMRQGQDADPSTHWLYDDVKEVLEYDILQQFIQMIRFENTNRGVPFAGPKDDDTSLQAQIELGFWRSFSKTIGEKSYDNLVVEVEYPQNTFYLSLNDGDYFIGPEDLFSQMGGGLTSMLLGLFGNLLQVFRTSYDMVVPVIITVTDISADRSAFNNQGYEFRFALELNIRNNEPFTKYINLAPVNRSQRKNLITDVLSFPDTHYNIVAFDAMTNEVLDNVFIEAHCGRKFNIGRTNSSGILLDRLPTCGINGQIVARKEGYGMDPVKFRNTAESVNSTIRIPMWEIKEKILRINKIHVAEYITGDLGIDKAINLLTAGLSRLLASESSNWDRISVLMPPVLLYEMLDIEDGDETTTFDQRIEKYNLASMIFNLASSIGKGALAAIFPVGTVAFIGIELLEVAVNEAFGLQFPIPLPEYKEILYNSNKYKIEHNKIPLENETALITFNRNSPSEFSTRVPTIGIYDFNDTLSETKIQLIPGNYSIGATLLYDENITIPEEHVCGTMEFMNNFCEQFGVGQKIEEKTLEGWVLYSDDYYFMVNPRDLYDDNKEYLDVYVLTKGLPDSWMTLPGKDYWDRISIIREEWETKFTNN